MTSNIQKILEKEAMEYTKQQRKMRQLAWESRNGTKKRQANQREHKQRGDWLTVSRKGRENTYVTSLPNKATATSYNTFTVLQDSEDQETEKCNPVVKPRIIYKHKKTPTWAGIAKISVSGVSPKVWEKPSSIIKDKPMPIKVSDYVVKKVAESNRVRDAWSDDEDDAPKKSWNEIMGESDDED